MQEDGLQEMWRRIEEVRYWEGGGGSHQRVGAAEEMGGRPLLVSLPSEWHPALAVSLGDLQFRLGWLEGEDTCGWSSPRSRSHHQGGSHHQGTLSSDTTIQNSYTW